MKINRRTLLAGSAALAIAPRQSEAWRIGKQSGITQFIQGALGGGGFATNFASSPDRSLSFLLGNTPNLYRWRSSTSKWDNNTTSPAMDGLGIKPMSVGVPSFCAVGPDNLRVYLVSNLIGADNRLAYVNSGGGNVSQQTGQLYRSDDGGNSWFKPGGTVGGTLTAPLGVFTNSGTPYGGPFICVDPNNKDILWGQTWSGMPFVTYNGGVTIHILLNFALAAMPNCTSTQSIKVGSGTFTVDSNPLNGAPVNGSQGANNICYDYDNPFALGGSTNTNDSYQGGTATQVSVGATQPKSGTLGVFNSPSVQNGDRIFFGKCGAVVVDGSSQLVANPGIALGDPGAAGSASSVVYFAWNSGPTAIWTTSTAGGDLTGGNFSVLGTGGPTLDTFGFNKLTLSNDATLAGNAPNTGGNILYVTVNMNNHTFAWRWVGTPPTGSGLSANTWTQITNIGLNVFKAVTDPRTKGRVCYVGGTGFFRLGTNFGTTLGTLNFLTPAFTGDTPWLVGGDSVSMGDAELDPGVADKMWVCDGVGVYYFTINDTGAQTTWTANMQQMQSYICTHITKCPSPNGNILLCGQDRPQVTCTSPTVVPPTYFPLSTTVSNGGYTDYAKDNPNVVFFSQGKISRNTNKGVAANWVTIGDYRVLPANPFTTTLNSSTVNVHSPSHGYVGGEIVGFFVVNDFNNVAINNKQFTVASIVDANNYTITVSTLANANGSGGGTSGGIIGGGPGEGQRGGLGGGTHNMISLTSTQVLAVSTAGSHSGYPPYRVQYGSSPDGGTTWNWQPSTYSSNTLDAGGGTPLWPGNIKPVTIADSVIWYIDLVTGSATINTLFKSVDGGLTFTAPGGTGGIAASFTGYSQNLQIAAISGFANHVLVAQGQTASNNPLRRTRDGGVTWESFAGVNAAWGVAVGPNVTPNTYPSVYLLGIANNDGNYSPNIYRCDDMNPNNTTCTWKKLPGLEKANCESMFNGIYADPEVPGSFYLATADTGYVKGFLT